MDLERLKLPINEDFVAGENQEYTDLYLALDELATGVPESQMGNSIIEGKSANWHQLRKNCLELWESTRDLRVAVYIAISGLALEGYKGFSDGLELIKYLLEEMWEEFYPRLDEEDNFDPIERLNIINMISPEIGAYNDPLRFICLLRNQRLSSQNGYTLRDLLIVEQELDGGDDFIDLNLFNAEMNGLALEEIVENREIIKNIICQLDEITRLFDTHNEIYSLTFVSLRDNLKKLLRFYDKHILLDSSDAEFNSDVNTDNTNNLAVVNIANFKPKNRSEALMLLERAGEYFQMAEPSSPLPLLINRALRMAEMSFMDILAEVDENSIERGRIVFGVKTSNED